LREKGERKGGGWGYGERENMREGQRRKGRRKERGRGEKKEEGER
jgi:hypothetical protein